MIGTGCSGSEPIFSLRSCEVLMRLLANAVRYGTARAEWFLNVVRVCLSSKYLSASLPFQTVVLPNGKVIKTRRRARKSSTGFDTTKLFIGAEGTLGIVTEGAVSLSTDCMAC